MFTKIVGSMPLKTTAATRLGALQLMANIIFTMPNKNRHFMVAKTVNSD
jgi:hypothetical protein